MVAFAQFLVFGISFNLHSSLTKQYFIGHEYAKQLEQ